MADATTLSGRDALVASLKAMFPWMETIGLDLGFFHELAATATTEAEVLGKLRQTNQYKSRFQGLFRQNGEQRMTEAEYLAREQDYRNVLRQYGFDQGYDNPASLKQFFDNEIDPNELRDRVQTYKNVQSAGREVKEAFYVYAGMNISDDDLYAATVDPSKASSLEREYNARVNGAPFDYQTWITRATEVGLQRVSEQLGELQKSGAVTGSAVAALQRTDPGFARQIMDAIYHGGDPASGNSLPLADLLSAFEYAGIGAAAKNAGLEMPTKERVAELRQAGVDRAKAVELYSQYGQQRNSFEGAVQRAGLGTEFTQQNFEDAAMLGDAGQMGKLNRALAQEKAAGEDVGTFGFAQDRSGRIRQTGFTPA